MTFLKKLGSIVFKIVGIWSGIAPILQSATPAGSIASTVEDKLGKAFGVIITAEQMFAATGGASTGSEKLKAATPFVAQLIQSTDLLIGKKPKDEVKFEAAATALTSALADILNSFGD